MLSGTASAAGGKDETAGTPLGTASAAACAIEAAGIAGAAAAIALTTGAAEVGSALAAGTAGVVGGTFDTAPGISTGAFAVAFVLASDGLSDTFITLTQQPQNLCN